MRRTGLAAAVVAFSLLGGAGAYYLLDRVAVPSADEQADALARATDEGALPDGWKQRAVTPEEEKAGILLKLERSPATSSFLMRSIVGKLDTKVDTKAVAAASEAALRRDVKGLKNLTQETAVFQERETVHFTYEQTSKGDTTTTDLYILPTQRQTFYLSFRTDSPEHDALADERETILNQVIATISKKAPEPAP